jgi:hypothetical protein
LISCEEEFVTLDPSLYGIKFGKVKETVVEGNVIVSLPVNLVAAEQSSAVTADIVLSGTAVAGQDYEIVGGKTTINIPAGQYSDTIKIQLIDEFETDGNKDLIINFANISGGLKAGIGTAGVTYTLTIADNDCPFDVNDYVGAYDMIMTLQNGFIYAAGTYNLEATLTLGAEPNTLVDPDFGYLAASGRAPVPVTIQIDPSTATTFTKGSNYTFGDGSSVTDAVYAYGTSPNERYFTGGGLGNLSPCEGSFTVKALIRRQDGSVGQVLTLTYIKK